MTYAILKRYMQKIIPHIWFDKEAKEAAELYVSAFGNSEITNITELHNTPSGDSHVVSFNLNGYSFMAISAGPYFKANPSISFMVNFDPSQDAEAEAHLHELWNTLSQGGKILMPLQEYPFSKLYGWVEDKFGVSWQIMLTNPDGELRPFIIPSLLFTKEKSGKTEEATDFYLSVFKNAKRGTLVHYEADMGPNKKGEVMFTDFTLENQWFSAMDGGDVHDFTFSEGISLLVNCENQEEIDHLWEKLSSVPEAEQCGWCKDKYGVSWQITSKEMQTLMAGGNQEQTDRVTQAFLKMKKIDINTLREAAQG